MEEKYRDPEYLKTFLAAGFQVQKVSGGLRLIRGHCEVHLADEKGRLILAIPVVRFAHDASLAENVLAYLHDRNSSGKGPGVFSIRADCIWYQCDAGPVACARPPSEIALLALKLQEAVERLGPKVLNLMVTVPRFKR